MNMEVGVLLLWGWWFDEYDCQHASFLAHLMGGICRGFLNKNREQNVLPRQMLAD